MDVDQMCDELTPEQFDEQLAAMRAEPWGEMREDYRFAYLIWWLTSMLWTDEDSPPPAQSHLQHMQRFMKTGKSDIPEPVLSPNQAAKLARMQSARLRRR